MKFFGKKSVQPAAPVLSEPMSLRSDTLTFAVGVTQRREIERSIGPAITYPAAGWQTWTVAGLRGETWILSAFYRANVLIGVEHYLAKTENLPRYAPRIKGLFKLMPVGLGLGSPSTNLPRGFAANGGRLAGVRTVVYGEGFEARWLGGVALVGANDGRIERLAVYGSA